MSFDYYDADGKGYSDDYLADTVFLEFMNDNFELVNIAGHEYPAGRALKEVDPIAYRQAYLDWLDSEITEGNYTEAAA